MLLVSLGTRQAICRNTCAYTACMLATRVAHNGNAKLLCNSVHANQDYDLTTSSMHGCTLLLPLRDALVAAWRSEKSLLSLPKRWLENTCRKFRSALIFAQPFKRDNIWRHPGNVHVRHAHDFNSTRFPALLAFFVPRKGKPGDEATQNPLLTVKGSNAIILEKSGLICSTLALVYNTYTDFNRF